jgi:hypothetical protein
VTSATSPTRLPKRAAQRRARRHDVEEAVTAGARELLAGARGGEEERLAAFAVFHLDEGAQADPLAALQGRGPELGDGGPGGRCGLEALPRGGGEVDGALGARLRVGARVGVGPERLLVGGAQLRHELRGEEVLVHVPNGRTETATHKKPVGG